MKPELKSVTFKRGITCPVCGGSGERILGYEIYNCTGCGGSGTIEKDVTFELWEDCPYCRYESNPRLRTECNKCQNTHKVPHYITPAEWEKAMGEELRNDARVYLYTVNNPTYHKKWVRMYYEQALNSKDYCEIVLYIPGQPAPADDWRPE